MTDADAKKRRQNILDFYRRNCAIPFWKASLNHDGKSMDKICTMGDYFKRGVYMSFPHSHFYDAFNRIDDEVRKEMGIE